ncbi:MAG: hypothetical protein ACFFCQ_04415, partial [Promethearchaeota archaeon]
VPEDTHIVPIAVPKEMTSIDILMPQDTPSVGVISSEIIQDKTIQESRIPKSTTIDLHPLPNQDEVEVIIPKDTQTLSILVPEDSSKVDLFIPEDSDHLDIVVPDGLKKLKVTDIETGSVKEIKIAPDQKTVALSAPEGQQRIRVELSDEIRKLDVIVKDRSSLILPVSESTTSVRVELPEEADKISTFLPTEVKEIDLAPPTSEESIETITPLVDKSIQVEFPISDHFIPPSGIHDTIDITPSLFLKEKPLTSSLEYISVSEVTNPHTDAVDQMETTDVIPLAWQVIGHSLEGGTLVSRKLEKKKGIAYTWKWDKFEAGQTRKVSYSLRKRLHRTVVQLKGKKIQTQSSYHSIEQGSDGTWQVGISFKSTFEETVPLVLIEDTIPPEVLIRSYSSGDFRPIILPSSDSTIFRWILKDLTPIDSFEVNYEFSDKPITMIHVRNIVDENKKELLYLERIVQPVEDALGMAYYYYTKIQVNKALAIRLEETIPLDFKHKGTNPAWFEPKIIEQEDMKILQWKQTLNRNDGLSFVMLVKGSKAFAVTFPLLTIEGYHRKDAKIERIKKREKLDLRKLISC